MGAKITGTSGQENLAGSRLRTGNLDFDSAIVERA
jgi:hypothetical protein